MFLEKRIAKTEYGFVRGVPAGNPSYTVFKGVPFAKAKRWAPPQEPDAWDDVRMCTEFPPAAIQVPGRNKGQGLYNKEFKPAAVDESEDCLYLNIWTPSIDESAKLPVMFWIHGGGYVNGYSYEMEFDGEEFAKRGVVLVTVPYRLASLGFFAHPELSKASAEGTSGNYAVRDVISALRWVKRNISYFGGDFENVTVFGQSAGGGMTQTLCTLPATKGLFKRAIIQSAGDATATLGSGMTLQDAEEFGVKLCECCGKTISELQALDGITVNALLLEAAGKILDQLPFSPVIDGNLILESSGNAFKAGRNHNIEYMTGSVAGDGVILKSRGAPIIPTRWAEAALKNNQNPLYLYYFDRMMPGDDAGAFHSSELWYVFGTLSRCWRSLEPGFTAGDWALSSLMLDYWTNFAKTGNPSNGDRKVPEWSAYTAENHAVMHFNELLPGLTEWDSLLKKIENS